MNPSSFNAYSILNGVSKALSVANQAIPLYKQVSPMIKNAKNVYSVVKDLGKSKPLKNNFRQNKPMFKEIPEKKEPVYKNPIFFQ